MIKSFRDSITEKIFLGETLKKKERKAFGDLDIAKVKLRLEQLDEADEKILLMTTSLHYHKLQGTDRYSIDASGRRSKWRVTFSWENDEMKNVQLVTIEDTHS